MDERQFEEVGISLECADYSGYKETDSSCTRGDPADRLTEAQSNMESTRPEASGNRVSVVIPVYCSEKSLTILAERLHAVFAQMDRELEVVFVDDCSSGGSWRVLKELKQQYGPTLKIARLLVNSGQHNAILCGLRLSTGNIIVTMDDDLQNPPEEIPKMVEAVEQGYDLVIGAYDVKKHGSLRNAGGKMVDRTQRLIFGLPDDFQLTSFRAVRRQVVENVCAMGGVFPYVTAMLLSHAATYTNVPVRHDPRPFGSSNYNIRRSLLLAANLIFSYSAYPLYAVATFCGMALFASLALGVGTLWRALMYGISVPGWASTIVVLSLFNSLILLSLLIFGVYLSRISQQMTRARVSYTIGELYE